MNFVMSVIRGTPPSKDASKDKDASDNSETESGTMSGSGVSDFTNTTEEESDSSVVLARSSRRVSQKKGKTGTHLRPPPRKKASSKRKSRIAQQKQDNSEEPEKAPDKDPDEIPKQDPKPGTPKSPVTLEDLGADESDARPEQRPPNLNPEPTQNRMPEASELRDLDGNPLQTGAPQGVQNQQPADKEPELGARQRVKIVPNVTETVTDGTTNLLTPAQQLEELNLSNWPSQSSCYKNR